jgi:hypothetical protein
MYFLFPWLILEKRIRFRLRLVTTLARFGDFEKRREIITFVREYDRSHGAEKNTGNIAAGYENFGKFRG